MTKTMTVDELLTAYLLIDSLFKLDRVKHLVLSTQDVIVVAERVSWSCVSCQQCPCEEGALHSTHQTQVLPEYGCGVPLNKVGGRVLVHLLVFVNCRPFSHLPHRRCLNWSKTMPS